MIDLLFANLRQSAATAYVDSPGPYLPSVHSKFAETIEKEIVAVRNELILIKDYNLNGAEAFLSGKNGSFHRQLNSEFFPCV